MNYLECLLPQRINSNPIAICNNHLGNFTQPGYIAFTVPWEYDFVNARQNFKKGYFHGALFIRGLQYLLIIIFKAQ